MDVSFLMEVVMKTEDEEEISSRNEDSTRDVFVTSTCAVKEEHSTDGSDDEDDDNNANDEDECERPFAVTLPYIKTEHPTEDKGTEMKGCSGITRAETFPFEESSSDENYVEAEDRPVTAASKASNLRKGVGKDLHLSHACTICKMVFPQERMLRDHRCGLPTDPIFGCEECGRAFPQSSMLKRHWYLHHKARKLPCLCDTCGKSFLDPSHLKTHQRTHTVEQRRREMLRTGRDTWRWRHECKNTLYRHGGLDVFELSGELFYCIKLI